MNVAAIATIQKPVDNVAEPEKVSTTSISNPNTSEVKISAFSLKSIQEKRALEQSLKTVVKDKGHHPTEPFTETEMLLHWTKYAQKLGDKGYKIMQSLLLINDPTLNGSEITMELPNEGSKIEFETEMNGLLGHLRGHLHNHDIKITVLVNETIENKFAFTPQDKYNRMNEINPNLELLRKTFDLNF